MKKNNQVTSTVTRLLFGDRNISWNLRLRSIRADQESGVAIMSAIMLVVIITMLSVLVLGFVLAELRPTLLTNKNTRTASAAQAGIDAAISQIRNATEIDGAGALMGDIHKLPCVVNGPVEGIADGTAFKTKVAYFKEDPEGKDAEWRAENALACYTAGTNVGLRAVPRYAIISSEGTDASARTLSETADRTLEAKYTFPLVTRTISGGQIMDSGSQFCLVAVSATSGSQIKYQAATSDACKEASELSLWSWRSDYMIHLSMTDVDGRVPLCLSGRPNGSGPTPMTLKPCDLGTTDPLGQRFRWTGNHTWQGQNAANTNEANSFIVSQSNPVRSGVAISVATSSGNPKPVPLPAVGKGNASKETDQIVNQSLFGRCLDVTDVRIDKAYMITYPCKQDPSNKGKFDWNHKWYYDEVDVDNGQKSVTTKIKVVDGVATSCLITTTQNGIIKGDTGQMVNLPGNPHKNYKYPRFRTSSNGTDCSSSSTNWIRYGDTGDDKTAWTIQDTNGRCLSADGPAMHTSSGWKAVVVETCNGRDYQKWNVPEDPNQASLRGYTETTGRDS